MHPHKVDWEPPSRIPQKLRIPIWSPLPNLKFFNNMMSTSRDYCILSAQPISGGRKKFDFFLFPKFVTNQRVSSLTQENMFVTWWVVKLPKSVQCSACNIGVTSNLQGECNKLFQHWMWVGCYKNICNSDTDNSTSLVQIQVGTLWISVHKLVELRRWGEGDTIDFCFVLLYTSPWHRSFLKQIVLHWISRKIYILLYFCQKIWEVKTRLKNVWCMNSM